MSQRRPHRIDGGHARHDVDPLDGRKPVVADSPETVVDENARFRARVLSAADDLRSTPNRPADVVQLVRPEPAPE